MVDVFDQKSGNNNKNKIIIKLKKFLVPTVGDKITTRTGQKGTIGIIYSEADVFCTKQGVVPDLIINPNSFPKRMTINYLYEVFSSIYAVLTGKVLDATMMQTYDDADKEPYEIVFDFLENINKKINGFGIGEFGMQKVFNQHTSKCAGEVLIGFVYVAALEQKAQNKIYSVAQGQSNK